MDWVNANIPLEASVAADYFMAVSLPHHEIYPLHPQRYYHLAGRWKIYDYFVNPFGIPAYYNFPAPGHFTERTSDFPDYVLLPVNHGGIGDQLRFDRFMRSPVFTDNYTRVKEFADPYGHRTILYPHNPPLGAEP